MERIYMKGDYFICAWCGKLAWMEQWLIDEKLALGYKLVCSHECGKHFIKQKPLYTMMIYYNIEEVKQKCSMK